MFLPTRSCFPRPGLVLALAFAAVHPLAAQVPVGDGDVAPDGTTVEVLVEVRAPNARIPTDLDAGDFEVLEDGQAATVVSAHFLGSGRVSRESVRRAKTAVAPRPWQLLVYVDAVLLCGPSRRTLAEALASQAAELTALGSVEVVVADPEPRIWLGATRDPKLIRSTLESIGLSPSHSATLRAQRRRFLDRELYRTFRLAEPEDWDLDLLRNTMRSAVAAESQLVASRLETLRWWLITHPASLPKGLVWATDGFDLTLEEFYLAGLGAGSLRDQLEEDLVEYDLRLTIEDAGQLAGALGWTMLPLWVRSVRTTAFEWEGERPGLSLLRSSLLVNPVAALDLLSEMTGGRVVVPSTLSDSLVSVSRRYLVAYRVERTADLALHRVEVRSPVPRLKVRAAPWRADGPPAGVTRNLRADCRLEDASEGSPEADADSRGKLVLCDVHRGYGQSAPPDGSSLLVTVLSEARHSRRERVDLDFEVDADEGGPAAGFRIAAPLPPHLHGRPLTVVVTDLDRGLWAVEHLPAADGATAISRAAEEWGLGPPGALASSKAIHLVPFERSMVAGVVLVEAQATRQEIVRVDFWVDDLRVATAGGRPFEAWLRLGDVPEPHTIRAVAYGAWGRESGRDEMRINQGLGRARVRISEPTVVAGPGDYEVQIEVDAPPSKSATAVELFWNEEPLARFEHPPYRVHVALPQPEKGDYLRAVASFADGEVTEDTLLVSGEAFHFEADVDLIELYTVVEDRFGRPLPDLRGEEFEILEEGVPQTVESFEYAENAPLVLGLTIDVSESMLDRMPIVKVAAEEFVERLLSPRDRAFLAAFNHRPQLLQAPTDDPKRLFQNISELPNVGGTALFDAIIFSLLHLRDLTGRKALVVLTDGKDRHSRFSLSSALEFARRSAIPVYIIGIDSLKEPLDLEQTQALRRIVRFTGGRIYLIRSEEELDEIYRTIATELRHQYVLSYQSSHEGKDTGWREIRLGVSRPGARARTILGYFPNP